MILDYNPAKDLYSIRVPRSDAARVKSLMAVEGFDFSASASTSAEAVLFTNTPYAAVQFAEQGTPRARAKLKGITDEIDASWLLDSRRSVRSPQGFELRPFQRASVAYALRRTNTLVGDQPGLGKTPIAVCFANEIQAARVLVICPASIRLQWVRRIREWTVMPWPYIVYPVLSGRHGVHPTAEWTVVSYDLARTPAIGRALAQGRYDLLILDEAHYIKTSDSERTRAIFGDHTGWMRRAVRNEKGHVSGHEKIFEALAARSQRILALTGTPLPNRPREAYTLAKGLNFDAIDWMSEVHFKERFNPLARITGSRRDGSLYQFNREEVGRLGEFNARLRANFMVRHLKRDVLPQLALPVYDVIQVQETGVVKQALEAESLLDIDPERLSNGEAEVLGVWAVVRHLMGQAIAPQVADYAEMLLDGGEDKLVIGAWHRSVLDILQKRLEKFGVLRVDGTTSAAQKEERVKAFVNDPKKHIIIGNIMSLGTGTDDLQKVSAHVLLAEPDVVPGNNEQFVDRLDRMGQQRTVQADFFVAPKSILENILVSALRKRRNTHEALDRRAA